MKTLLGSSVSSICWWRPFAEDLLKVHELSITQSMLDIVLQQAEKAKAKKVTKINLIIGEMTAWSATASSFTWIS